MSFDLLHIMQDVHQQMLTTETRCKSATQTNKQLLPYKITLNILPLFEKVIKISLSNDFEQLGMAKDV